MWPYRLFFKAKDINLSWLKITDTKNGNVTEYFDSDEYLNDDLDVINHIQNRIKSFASDHVRRSVWERMLVRTIEQARNKKIAHDLWFREGIQTSLTREVCDLQPLPIVNVVRDE